MAGATCMRKQHSAPVAREVLAGWEHLLCGQFDPHCFNLCLHASSDHHLLSLCIVKGLPVCFEGVTAQHSVVGARVAASGGGQRWRSAKQGLQPPDMWSDLGRVLLSCSVLFFTTHPISSATASLTGAIAAGAAAGRPPPRRSRKKAISIMADGKSHAPSPRQRSLDMLSLSQAPDDVLAHIATLLHPLER